MGTIIYSEGRRFVWDLSEREAKSIGFKEFSDHQVEPIPLFSLEEKKVLLRNIIPDLEEEYRKCRLCPKNCGINREKELGYCSITLEPYYFAMNILVSEESLISPTFAVFFQGCNLKCVYCHAQPNNSSQQYGAPYHPEQAGRRVNDISSIRTLSFIGGNPDNNIRSALETILWVEKEIPIIWNTNLYVHEKSLEFLDRIVEVYVVDFKAYKNCAESICGEKNYFNVITKNLRYIRETQPRALVIIRHLLLPGHIGCCLEPILGWIKYNCKGVKFSLITGYYPWHRAMKFEELKIILRDDEIEKARDLIRKYENRSLV